jgi:hypothetical protein
MQLQVVAFVVIESDNIKEMTMANWFEDITKTVADEKLSRRQTLRRIAGSVAGVTLATWLPGQVLAKSGSCGNPATCGGTFSPCGHNKNCFCFLNSQGKGSCGCIVNICNKSENTCKTDKDCSSGSFCAKQTCCPHPNVCLPKCGKTCK